MKKMLKCSKGFTLIELMVVIIIVGVLASISVPIYRQYVRKAMGAEGQALVGSVAAAAKVYYAEHVDLPATYTSTAGSADTTLGVDASQNKYFRVFTFTRTSSNAFTVSTSGVTGGDADGITVTLTQGAATAPTIAITGI
jgi:prepilin-type N-terminal cleavage/methylation domain-containing protein